MRLNISDSIVTAETCMVMSANIVHIENEKMISFMLKTSSSLEYIVNHVGLKTQYEFNLVDILINVFQNVNFLQLDSDNLKAKY